MDRLTFDPELQRPADIELSFRLAGLVERGFNALHAFSVDNTMLGKLVVNFQSPNRKMLVEVHDHECIYKECSTSRATFVLIIDKNHYDGMKNNNRVFIACNKDEATLIEFIETLKIAPTENSDTISVEYFYLHPVRGLSSNDIEIEQKVFAGIMPELYPTVDIAALSQQYKEAREPILMLYGSPGLGKTSFIKYILEKNQWRSIAYAKDPKAMQDGEFWASMNSGRFDLIILDDLDINLGPRSKSKDTNFMSNLLTLSDGVFTTSECKIIITTNQELKSIDSALVRPGRCFDFIKLEPLTRKEAFDIWKNLLKMPKNTFHFEGDIVPQSLLMSEYDRLKHNHYNRSYIKRGERNYTVEDKIRELGIRSAK
jgi:hypothetical protein